MLPFIDGNRNQIEAEVLVILKDVNDNAPEMPTPNVPHWSVSENLKKVTCLVLF